MRKITLLLLLCSLTLSVLAQTQQDLSNQALAAYNKKEFALSASLYSKAIQYGALDADNHYNAACSYALAGDKENAFLFLERSIKMGYTNVEHLKVDTDLDSLHTDPRWPRIVDLTKATGQRFKNQWDGPAWKIPYQSNLTTEAKVAGLSRLWSEVKFNFANFDLVPTLDWDSLYMDCLPKVIATKSTADYYSVLTRMITQLHDGHTNVYIPDTLVNATWASPAFRTRLVENKVIVAIVWDEELRKQGIREGIELLEIDGQPVKDYARQTIMPYQSASTSQDLEARTYEYALLWGAAGSFVKLKFTDGNGKPFDCQVKRITPGERRKSVQNTPVYQLKWLKDSIAFVSLNSFESDKTADDFLKDFDVISRARAIIFDIRNNGGGSSDVGYKILACLTRKPFPGSGWRTRDYRPSFRAWGNTEGWYGFSNSSSPPNGKYIYERPVYVLTGPKTFSAAEDFAVAFDGMHRGLIVGEPTGGSTGQPLFFYLPGGGSARVCTKRDTYPDGKDFVGVGIQPNIPVKPTVADYRKSRDTILEATLAEIGKKH